MEVGSAEVNNQRSYSGWGNQPTWFIITGASYVEDVVV